MSRVVLPFLILASISLTADVWAQTSAASTQELKRMSLAELLDLQVTTVSKVPEQASSVPAAVYVITGDDIRRSGATSIPEALRLAPGVQVARISAGAWAIGIRGFADRLARSVLVLIDGRAVYSPLFAGTYWESQDTVLGDIDRIEIVRGPGGTLWGANAVNGIINIITKASRATQGLLVQAGGGSEDRAFGTVRYGGTHGNASYRLYFKALDRGPEFHADGADYDSWHAGQGGFRADWSLAQSRQLTVQGDVYDARLGGRTVLTSFTPPFSQTLNVKAPISGGNVLSRLSGKSGSRGDYQVQVYYDRTNRDEQPVGESRDTADVDFQETLRWTRQTVTVGAYRITSGRITAIAPSEFDPSTRTDHLYTAFAQDEIVLSPNRWRLTVGSKLEHNDYSGFEAQPSVRLLWSANESQSAWGAVTRAVRTPSRVETDYTTAALAGTTPIPTFVRLEPNPDFTSEDLVATELGYRVHPHQRVFVTASGFYNDFTNTLSTELLKAFVEVTPPPVRLILPVTFANGLHGNSYGGELTSDVRPYPWWRLTGNYSYVKVVMSKNPGGNDVSQEQTYEGRIPHHQVQASSSIDMGRWSIDYQFRHISPLASVKVPGYSASTLRAGWRPDPRLELAVVAQDLFDDHHLEWPSGGAGGNIEIQRSIYASVTWRR